MSAERFVVVLSGSGRWHVMDLARAKNQFRSHHETEKGAQKRADLYNGYAREAREREDQPVD